MTVFLDNVYLVGITFTYVDGGKEEFHGDGNTGHGPIREVDFNLDEGEFIVGATIKTCSHYMRGIGFTVLRLN